LARKIDARKKRKVRIRKKISGTSVKPRLCVFKSTNHIYAQLVDDTSGQTITAASSLDKSMKDFKGHKGNADAARAVGEMIGKRAMEKEIQQVVFDRGGYLYHGRVKALADAAREAGLKF
jgi:large subunit ribosomal protein L18